MSNKITGKEYPLSKIFSAEFDYHIPAYQRPYAWTEEETGTLFDDLYDFYQTEATDNYFLGSIVLIKDEDKPHADVIDGQQRLTTLTILFSAIASHLTGDDRNECIGFLREPGKKFQGLAANPRLHLRSKDQDFFEKYIQNVKLNSLMALDMAKFPDEAQQHIFANCKVFLDRIEKNFGRNPDPDDLCAFLSFMLQRCYLVAVYTPSQQSAFRVFSVMNNRGLDLLPADIIKSEVIGKIPEAEQQSYTDKWEDLEIMTTRNGFNEVLTHTRMIFAKNKAKKNILDEFREFVVSTVTPEQLIDDILEPYSEAYIMLKNKNYVATKYADQVNSLLSWLNKIDNSDWMPPAIKFIAEHQNEPDYVLWFFTNLERLASYLHITAKDINQRIERYGKVLMEMSNKPNHSISSKLTSVELGNAEKAQFLKALDGEIYHMTARRRNYLILRLDSFVSDGAASYDPAILTIEHVLPQTVAANSEWETLWPDVDEREKWLNRIANLVPLTRRHNSEAQNYDFDYKKKIYFTSKAGTTSYALTTQVIAENVWSPDLVADRQAKLLGVFREKWDLKPVQNEAQSSSTDSDRPLFYLRRFVNEVNKQAEATGRQTNEGFVVYKGSHIISVDSDTISVGIKKERENANIDANGILQEDVLFSSPSGAAMFVIGLSSNGRSRWKTAEGKTFEEVESEKAKAN